MSLQAKKMLLFLGVMGSVVCACLGLETKHSNHLGWALLFASTVFITAGCIHLGTLFINNEGRQSKGSLFLWLPYIGVLSICLLTPLEYLFLPAVLPRSDYTQDVGLVLFSGGIVMVLLSLKDRDSWRMAFPKRPSNATRLADPFAHGLVRLLLCPAAVGPFLLISGLGVGYSSILGLLLLLPMVLSRLLIRTAV
jgi:hypothetical protein